MTVLKKTSVVIVGLLFTCINVASAQDWSQWRGANRDAVASDFLVPSEWPKELIKKWSIQVGNGVASPSVKGDKIYVMALQDGQEVMRCLNSETGEEIWKDQYTARAASGPARGFPGTRSSPTISDDYVVTLGVDGTVSCWNAESGKLNWQNNDYRGKVPRFSTSSSPLIADGKCIVQFGTDSEGGIVAYDLKTGNESWKWTQSGSAYGSPVLLTLGDNQFVLAAAATQLVALSLTDGTSMWSMDYRQGRYNAATPIVDGQTVFIAGPNRGITALEFNAAGDKITTEEKWRNEDSETTLIFNTPVLFQGNLFGISTSNQLFCVRANDGQMTWNQAISTGAAATPQPSDRVGRGEGDAAGRGERGNRGNQDSAGGQQKRGGRQRGGRRGGGGRGGYGSIVSAGSVLLGLSPNSELMVIQPLGEEFRELARYKVSESPTYAYPVPVGNRIYIKDQDSLTLWTLN